MQFLSLNMGSTTDSFSSSSSSVIRFSILISFAFQIIHAATFTPPNNNGTIPALIAFGDSILDPGNNNYINTMAKCNFPPYGRDFMGGIPTGRFSNGKIPTDMLAEFFGIKKLLPAYLDPILRPEDLLTGVSFASGGAGFDPLTAQLVSVLSLSDQLKLFKEYIDKVKAAYGGERTVTILSKSVFLVCAGSDDIANTYFNTRLRSDYYDLPAYADLMVSSASTFIKELFDLGVRKIGVLSAPPVGCVPAQRTIGGGEQRACAEKPNQLANLFNSKLISELNSLSDKLPQSRLIYLDVYTPLFTLTEKPRDYGFEEVSKGCCGSGTVEVSLLCNSMSPNTCTDASKFVFWDSYHPSEKGYEALVDLVGPSLSKFY